MASNIIREIYACSLSQIFFHYPQAQNNILHSFHPILLLCFFLSFQYHFNQAHNPHQLQDVLLIKFEIAHFNLMFFFLIYDYEKFHPTHQAKGYSFYALYLFCYISHVTLFIFLLSSFKFFKGQHFLYFNKFQSVRALNYLETYCYRSHIIDFLKQGIIHSVMQKHQTEKIHHIQNKESFLIYSLLTFTLVFYISCLRNCTHELRKISKLHPFDNEDNMFGLSQSLVPFESVNVYKYISISVYKYILFPNIVIQFKSDINYNQLISWQKYVY